MAIVKIPGGMIVGLPQDHFAAAPAFTPGLLNSAAARVGQIIRMPKTGTLHSFEVMVGNITNAPDNGVKMSFQNITAGGIYDDVYDQYRVITPAANTWLVPPGPLTSDGTDTGVKRSVTIGDYVAVMLQFENFVTSDSMEFQRLSVGTGTAVGSDSLSYSVQAGFKTTAQSPLCMALRYTDEYVYLNNLVLPIKLMTSTVFASNSTPDERALRFQMPWNCEIDGFYVRATMTATTDIVLYDAAGSVLYTASLADNDWTFHANGGWNFFAIPPQAIIAATTYRVSVKPMSTTNITAYDFEVPSTTLMNIVAGGSELYLSTRTDAGAWTDVTTKRPWIMPRVSGIEAGSISGGGAFTFIG